MERLSERLAEAEIALASLDELVRRASRSVVERDGDWPVEHLRDLAWGIFGNAVAESFFATLKKELINRRSWPTKAELPTEVFDYIEVFYNRERRHSTLGQRSPADYEKMPLPVIEEDQAA